MRKMVNVIPKEDFILEIHLNNNHIIMCDMKERMKGIRFRSLSDDKKFNQFEIIEGTIIKWSDVCEMTLDEVLLMLER